MVQGLGGLAESHEGLVGVKTLVGSQSNVKITEKTPVNDPGQVEGVKTAQESDKALDASRLVNFTGAAIGLLLALQGGMQASKYDGRINEANEAIRDMAMEKISAPVLEIDPNSQKSQIDADIALGYNLKLLGSHLRNINESSPNVIYKFADSLAKGSEATGDKLIENRMDAMEKLEALASHTQAIKTNKVRKSISEWTNRAGIGIMGVFALFSLTGKSPKRLTNSLLKLAHRREDKLSTAGENTSGTVLDIPFPLTEPVKEPSATTPSIAPPSMSAVVELPAIYGRGRQEVLPQANAKEMHEAKLQEILRIIGISEEEFISKYKPKFTANYNYEKLSQLHADSSSAFSQGDTQAPIDQAVKIATVYLIHGLGIREDETIENGGRSSNKLKAVSGLLRRMLEEGPERAAIINAPLDKLSAAA